MRSCIKIDNVCCFSFHVGITRTANNELIATLTKINIQNKCFELRSKKIYSYMYKLVRNYLWHVCSEKLYRMYKEKLPYFLYKICTVDM